MAQPDDRGGRNGGKPEPADLADRRPQNRPDLRNGRRGGRRDQAGRLRKARRAVAAAESRLADTRPGKGQSVQQIYRKSGRNHYRRGLPGMEKGNTRAGRRRERTGAAESGTDPERFLPQGRQHQGDRFESGDEEQQPLHRSVAYRPGIPRTAFRDGGP